MDTTTDPSHSPRPAEYADAAAAMAMPAPAANHQPEARVLWSATEGQIVNAGTFVLAVLLCWLVLPVLYAAYRYFATAFHVYELTDQRLLVRSGIVVKQVETIELYRVKDIAISGSLLQSLVGRGRIILMTTDTTAPKVLINAVADPETVSRLIREAVEQCRVAKGVRAFDV